MTSPESQAMISLVRGSILALNMDDTSDRLLCETLHSYMAVIPILWQLKNSSFSLQLKEDLTSKMHMIYYNGTLAGRKARFLDSNHIEVKDKEFKEIYAWFLVAYRRLMETVSKLFDSATTSMDGIILKDLVQLLIGLLGNIDGNGSFWGITAIRMKVEQSDVWSSEDRKKYLDVENWPRRYLAISHMMGWNP